MCGRTKLLKGTDFRLDLRVSSPREAEPGLSARNDCETATMEEWKKRSGDA